MVSLPDVQSSNNEIAKLPAGLVAVFVGATNGIGEATLKEFARSAKSPRAYFVGRSQEAGNRITAECRQLNPEGEYLFIRADLSLIRNVDEVCREIKSKEKAINLLFLSCGAARYGFGKYKYYLQPKYNEMKYLYTNAPQIPRKVSISCSQHNTTRASDSQ
jgi:short-subunit dehydrogenase